MNLRFEHQCTQCGARLSLAESERLVQCGYCGVKSYLTSASPFHFVLPHPAAEDGEMIYLPYLRFRGNVFTCQGWRTDFRFIDITQIASPVDGLPRSLGLRPQAMVLRFLDPATSGGFLPPARNLADILAKVAQLGEKPSGEKVYHRAHVGERTSLVYLPLCRRQERIFDAVLNRPLITLRPQQELGPLTGKSPPAWKLSVLPTLCPVCGWQMEGEKDSAALVCRNCERVFESSGGQFLPLRHELLADEEKDAEYLPFWRMTVSCSNPPIHSFADFIRVTRQPRIPPPDWEKRPMNIWCPAFRIRPKVFLHLLRSATLSQPPGPANAPFGRKTLFPATLPSHEAAQTLKLALAALTLKKSDLYPLLPTIRFEIAETALVFLPFRDNGRELIQPASRIVIDRNALDFGRKL